MSRERGNTHSFLFPPRVLYINGFPHAANIWRSLVYDSRQHFCQVPVPAPPLTPACALEPGSMPASAASAACAGSGAGSGSGSGSGSDANTALNGSKLFGPGNGHSPTLGLQGMYAAYMRALRLRARVSHSRRRHCQQSYFLPLPANAKPRLYPESQVGSKCALENLATHGAKRRQPGRGP